MVATRTSPDAATSSSVSSSGRRFPLLTKRKSSTSTSSSMETVKHQHLTHTNSDQACLQAQSNFAMRQVYRVSVHNGHYMLQKQERLALNVVGWICTIFVLSYLSVLLKGFVDGYTTKVAME